MPAQLIAFPNQEPEPAPLTNERMDIMLLLQEELNCLLAEARSDLHRGARYEGTRLRLIEDAGPVSVIEIYQQPPGE